LASTAGTTCVSARCRAPRSSEDLDRRYGCIIAVMRTTVTLDDDVYEAAQAYAQATGKRLGRVLSEMARQALHSAVQRLGRGTSRFPVFDVPANARLIPASRAQKALNEDGIA